MVDPYEYGYEMFKAASSVAGMTVEEIINSDIKSFKLSESNMAIGQVMTMDLEQINAIKDDIINSLNKMCENGGYKIALLFVTDIIKNGSYLFYNENAKEILEDSYGIEVSQGVYMDGFVSRKKQMLPPLLENL